MNAETKSNAVELALSAATTMQTVIELRKATGLDEATVRAQLKTLAQQGQIEHIPGRGRYDGRYGLLRPIAKAAAAAQYDASKDESLVVIEAAPVLEIASGGTAESDSEDDNSCTCGAWRQVARERDELRAEVASVEQKRVDTTAELTRAMHDLDAIREALGVVIGGDIDPSDMTEVEIAQCAAQLITGELANARALNTKLEHLLGSERTANAALREQLDNTVSPEIGSIAPAGYLVRAPKRRPRVLTKHDSAQAAAMAAACNGSGRGDVYALVHVGTAKRGAVWRAA